MFNISPCTNNTGYLPVVEQAPISLSTFGCGSLLTSFKIFNSVKRSDLSDALAPTRYKSNRDIINR